MLYPAELRVRLAVRLADRPRLGRFDRKLTLSLRSEL